MYEREAQFYERFGKDAGISIPRCYAAHVDDGACLLLLEDMGACRVGARQTQDVADIETDTRHLARFHAKHWNEAPVPQHHFWSALSTDQAKRERTKAVLAGSIPRVAERYASSTAAMKLIAIGGRWLSVWDSWYGPDTDDLTLCHGDFHVSQVFFANAGAGRFAVFDWQFVNYGSGTSDLARLLVSSLGIPQRKEHEVRLRRIYYEELLKHGVTGYPLHRFERRYRQNTLWNLLMNFSGALLLDPVHAKAQGFTAERIEEMFFGRVLSQIEDNRVASILEHGPDWERYASIPPRIVSSRPAARSSAPPPSM